jgi:hypothetical protein
VAAVNEKVSYCLAGPPLPARSSCVAAMDESSNTSPKKVVYLVYIELATDRSIPFFGRWKPGWELIGNWRDGDWKESLIRACVL